MKEWMDKRPKFRINFVLTVLQKGKEIDGTKTSYKVHYRR